MTHEQQSPAKAPDYSGQAGRYWRMEPCRAKPDYAAICEMLLLNCPNAHVAWNHWIVTVIHLREIPNVEPAAREFAEATHEIMVCAVNPDYPVREPDDSTDGIHFLTPFDQVVQFQVPSDAAAVALGERMAQACCDGIISPDQDWRSVWREQVAKLAAHHRGEHGTGVVQ